MGEPIIVRKKGLFNKYKTIQQGIDAVQNGGVVYIEAGYYEEAINLEGKNISLIGRGKVVIENKNETPIITTSHTELYLEDVECVQKANANTLYIKEMSKVKVVNCVIQGSFNQEEAETKYPTIFTGSQSELELEKCTISAKVANSIYTENARLTLKACNIKDFGIYINQATTAHFEQISINYPSRYGIFSKESTFTINKMNMVGGGVVAMIENSEATLQGITSKQTYRDVLRITNSKVAVDSSKFYSFSEIANQDEKQVVAGIRALDGSDVTIRDVELSSGLFDAVEVYHSKLSMQFAKITNQHSGFYIHGKSSVYLDEVECNQLSFNAMVVNEQSSAYIKNSLFTRCGKNEKKHYPIIFTRQAARLMIENTQLQNSVHDAIYTVETSEVDLKKVTIDQMGTGVKVIRTPIKLTDLTIKNCRFNAVNAEESSVYLQDSLLENNNLESKTTYQSNSDIPTKLNAALHVSGSKIEAYHSKIFDKTAAISLANQSELNGEALQFVGGVFAKGSMFDIGKISFRNVESEPIHFMILHQTNGKIKFDNTTETILITRDMSSTLISNLKEKPRVTVIHNFQNDQIENPFENEEKMQLTGPDEFKETLAHLMKELSLYKLRKQQGIEYQPDWHMWWIHDTQTPLQKYFEQLVEMLVESEVFTKEDVIWVDDLDRLPNDIDMQKYVKEQLENPSVLLVLSGTQDTVEGAKEFAQSISKEVFFDGQMRSEIGVGVEKKLIEFQFVFDSNYLYEVIEENIADLDGDSERVIGTILQRIIKAQSDRLLNSENKMVEKEDIITLTKDDVFKGVTNNQ